MSIFSVILGFQIAFGLLEVVIFLIGAVLLGFAIHFFVTSRKSMNSMQKSVVPEEQGMTEADEWRLRYYEQIDLQKKVEEETRTELEEKAVNEKRLSKILNEKKLEVAAKEEQENLLKQKVEDLEKELNILRQGPSKQGQADVQAGEYLEQLASAQLNLSDHNQRINRLLEQISMLQESQRKHLEIKQTNETLQLQVRDLRQTLAAKESEINHLRQEQLLRNELKERLDKAHEEYNGLHEKLDKLEIQISKPHNRTFEYEELQQSFFRLTKECDEIRIKHLSLLEENQRLSRLLADTEDKLRESNFQRQQYLRKVTFLEELTHDLQEMSGQQKKLESQMRRISEIETLLKKSSENL